jgi:hypothetical protein
MRRLLRFLVTLYPHEWRRRYEAEFDALLESLPPSWSHVFNVAGGVVSMRMRSPLTILTIGLVAGGVLGGVLFITTRGEVFESKADVLVDATVFLRLDANGRPVTVERALAPLSARERQRVAIEFRVELADGTPVKSGQTLLRLTGRQSSPVAAQQLVQRLINGVESVTSSVVVVNGPSVPGQPISPQLPATLNVLAVINSATQGLFVGYLWLSALTRKCAILDLGRALAPARV